MKFACFVHPHLGGTFSVYRYLRTGLASSGIQLRWLSAGADAHRMAEDPSWRKERSYGHACGRPEDSETEQAESLLQTLVSGGYDGVFVNVLADRVQTNIARYLPPHMLRIMIVHNITPGTYAAARAIRSHIHATVGVSNRIRDDLVAGHGFDPGRTFAIPNRISLSSRGERQPYTGREPFRLLSLGRIDDQAKGILWLPAIMQHLPPEITLTVAGDGPDLAALKSRCGPLRKRVAFLGAVAPERVPELFCQHHVFVAPSRFEGFLVTILEAMAQGCVPVVSLLRGVTDMTITDGATGALFPVGNVRAAATAILRLQTDAARYNGMSMQCRAQMAAQFTIDQMGRAYADLVHRLKTNPPSIDEPLSLRYWSFPAGLKDGFRALLPIPMKNMLRTVRERLA